MQCADKCPRCESQRLIKNVRIYSRGPDSSKSDLHVEVYGNPDALVFKKAHQETLLARICGDCGFTELYVSNARELWSVTSQKG